VHIVYVVDCSPSAAWKSRMLKAKKALRKALAELEATDTFSIVDFANDVHGMSETMLKPTPENVQRAFDYLDGLEMRGNFTDMSAAFDRVFDIHPLTHVFLLSDGESNGGQSDPQKLRRQVKKMN